MRELDAQVKSFEKEKAIWKTHNEFTQKHTSDLEREWIQMQSCLNKRTKQLWQAEEEVAELRSKLHEVQEQRKIENEVIFSLKEETSTELRRLTEIKDKFGERFQSLQGELESCRSALEKSKYSEAELRARIDSIESLFKEQLLAMEQE